MRALLAALIVAFAGPALAQQQCEPKTQFTPDAPGSAIAWNWTLDGVAAWWWCPVIEGGVTKYRPGGYGGRWADGWEAAKAAAPRVQSAAQPWVQFRVELATIEASMPALDPASREACARRALHHGACVALRTSALFEPPMRRLTVAEALDPARCGPAPDCSAITPPPAVWRTPGGGSSIYPVTAGRLGAPLAGRRAPGAALCDLARMRIVVGSYTYGSLAGGPANEAVLCVQVAA